VTKTLAIINTRKRNEITKAGTKKSGTKKNRQATENRQQCSYPATHSRCPWKMQDLRKKV